MELASAIFEWIEAFYNPVRLHSGIDYRSQVKIADPVRLDCLGFRIPWAHSKSTRPWVTAPASSVRDRTPTLR